MSPSATAAAAAAVRPAHSPCTNTITLCVSISRLDADMRLFAPCHYSTPQPRLRSAPLVQEAPALGADRRVGGRQVNADTTEGGLNCSATQPTTAALLLLHSSIRPGAAALVHPPLPSSSYWYPFIHCRSQVRGAADGARADADAAATAVGAASADELDRWARGRWEELLGCLLQGEADAKVTAAVMAAITGR